MRFFPLPHGTLQGARLAIWRILLPKPSHPEWVKAKQSQRPVLVIFWSSNLGIGSHNKKSGRSIHSQEKLKERSCYWELVFVGRNTYFEVIVRFPVYRGKLLKWERLNVLSKKKTRSPLISNHLTHMCSPVNFSITLASWREKYFKELLFVSVNLVHGMMAWALINGW